MISPAGARRLRPDMPHYGVATAADGMLAWDWPTRQMRAARNYWVCSTRADGRPHAAPVWGIWFEGAFVFGTDANSIKAANIRRDPRVSIHLESGDDVVIIEGELRPAQLSAESMAALEARYTEKYGLNPELAVDDALVLQLQPRKVLAWQEADFPTTATCWLFE
ncbi:MAG: pyridoxamine 5'-phosphate oxidase family protein [Chloroflexi bacterium]|nr:pyridoxamine 5'-phosphate oxidase family protein [Chloroflexota bacterium]MCY3581112.1 pyridoxamine 5'-phosphate oxidase family protein [Chloroflexota bacterium]MCY3715611.1 pyridoxamine 5'-phosphate oxidase family protein [Chloroflexota bacterium]MDE2650651.1 pyridoxamine 5'-phosphate oxidase family protein [Chloroflexota bacterium]MXX84696.1 pyridoxamine 5'-phosphate oxidase [Chloroflexota bacterium]